MLGASIHNACGAASFTITELGGRIGLHYERMHRTRFVKGTWKLVTFIDLRHFEMKKPETDWTVSSSYRYICSLNQYKNRCDKLFDQQSLSTRCHLARSYLQHIQALSVATIKREMTGSRTVERSVPFGFVGTIVKHLFGTLDEDDAKYYNAEIDQLYANQAHISRLIDNETHMIRSGFHTFREQIGFLREKTEALDKHMMEISEVVKN
uniref:Uncharacterized protein n=1 Tax=Bracon brevicornis TaxID=1563983 RepID=A0A6V7J333_9HYME